jgi:hypothetical protein
MPGISEPENEDTTRILGFVLLICQLGRLNFGDHEISILMLWSNVKSSSHAGGSSHEAALEDISMHQQPTFGT